MTVVSRVHTLSICRLSLSLVSSAGNTSLTTTSAASISCISHLKEDISVPIAVGGDRGQPEVATQSADAFKLVIPQTNGKSGALEFPPTRALYEDRTTYVVDAKLRGNVGRFLNVSEPVCAVALPFFFGTTPSFQSLCLPPSTSFSSSHLLPPLDPPLS